MVFWAIEKGIRFFLRTARALRALRKRRKKRKGMRGNFCTEKSRDVGIYE